MVDTDQKGTSMAEWELPEIDQKKCVSCGICVDACPQGVLALLEGKLIFKRPQDCTFCATCEESCPHDAVTCSYEIGWA
jgi:ferredoxin